MLRGNTYGLKSSPYISLLFDSKEMNKKRILIAHSDTEYMRLLQTALRKRGIAVSHKMTNAFEALRHIIEFQPKLAMLEVDFPYLSSKDIMKAIERKGIKTEIILILPPKYDSKLLDTHFIHQDYTLEQIENCIVGLYNNTRKWK